MPARRKLAAILGLGSHVFARVGIYNGRRAAQSLVKLEARQTVTSPAPFTSGPEP